SWIELDAAALRHNVATFRALLEADAKGGAPRGLGVVLKGNAYGHGLSELLPVLHPLVDTIFVISPLDALAIRRFEATHALPMRQVVVLGAVDADEAIQLAEAELEAVVPDASWAQVIPRLRAAGLTRPLGVHVHV